MTYAHKIEKEAGWTGVCRPTHRSPPACLQPLPGGATQAGDEVIKLWAAVPQDYAAALPGTVLAADADGVVVACGQGVLCMTLLQRAGGKRLAAGDFLRGFDLPEGAILDGAASGGTP